MRCPGCKQPWSECVLEDIRTIRYAIGDGNRAADDALDRLREYIEALIEASHDL